MIKQQDIEIGKKCIWLFISMYRQAGLFFTYAKVKIVEVINSNTLNPEIKLEKIMMQKRPDRYNDWEEGDTTFVDRKQLFKNEKEAFTEAKLIIKRVFEW